MSHSHTSPLPRAQSMLLMYRRMLTTTARCLKDSHLRPLGRSQAIQPPSLPKILPATSPSISALGSAADVSPLPYHVQRTASQGLPVYQLAKRGGNLHQTRIRKIKGDISALRDQLRALLKIKNDHAAINQVTGHIILKGWYKNEVKRFLEERYF